MFGRTKPFRVYDEYGLPLWMAMGDGEGFLRPNGGSFMLRTPLDRLLGRPGDEVLCCGVSVRRTLPPGTPLRGRAGVFGGVIGPDGCTVLFAPTIAPAG